MYTKIPVGWGIYLLKYDLDERCLSITCSNGEYGKRERQKIHGRGLKFTDTMINNVKNARKK